MSLFNVIDVTGSSLIAQSIRLNTISSNLANANVASGNAEETYRARYPVFSVTMTGEMGEETGVGVTVEEIIESQAPPRKEYVPGHPLADDDGYIYFSNVNAVEEMTNMISASRSYQSSIEAMNTAKQLIIQTLNLGK